VYYSAWTNIINFVNVFVNEVFIPTSQFQYVPNNDQLFVIQCVLPNGLQTTDNVTAYMTSGWNFHTPVENYAI
jgi:hypothetical protein